MDQQPIQGNQEPFQPYSNNPYPNGPYPYPQPLNSVQYPVYQPNPMQYNANYIPSAGIPANQVYVVQEKTVDFQARLNMITQQLATQFGVYYVLLWLMIMWSFLLIILWIVLLILFNQPENVNTNNNDDYTDLTPLANAIFGIFLGLAIYNLVIFLIGLKAYNNASASLNCIFKGFLVVNVAFEVFIIIIMLGNYLLLLYNIFYMVIVCMILHYCTRYGNLLNEKQALEFRMNMN